MVKKIFHIPVSYTEQIRKFDKTDAFLSLSVILLYCLTMGLSGIMVQHVSQNVYSLIGGFLNMLFVGIVTLLLKSRHQGMETIGLLRGNIKLSLKIGISLALILFFCNCLSNIWFANQSFLPAKEILIHVVYYFTVGLSEEVLFRGYAEPRLHALTKNVIVDVVLAGILFVLMHFPFRMVAYNISFIDLITNVPYIMNLFITHLVLSYIRIKSDSLYGAIIPHWISDLAYGIITH